MGEPIRADYQQLLLLPVSVEDWVGPGHIARFIRDFVETLDLGALGFEVGGAATGRPAYADELLLKVWLYGYLEKIRASRPLERACHEQMGLIWLTGRHAPDHNTLWRFWQAHRAAIKRVFKHVVQVAVKCNLVEVMLHAVDGTKIAAHASRRGVRTRAHVERRLEDLEAVVEAVMAEVEAAEAAAQGSVELPPEWQDTVYRRAQLREVLERLEAEDRELVHPGEPEAALMKTSAGVVPAFNAQVVVDSASELIVAQDVVTEPVDSYLLSPMVDAVVETVGQAAAQTVADAGYHTPQALATATARGYGVLVNESPQRAPAPDTPGTEFHTARFTYDAARDVCVCPRGEALRFERRTLARGHRAGARVYRCHAFRACPVRWQCSRDPRGRSVEMGEHHAAVLAQRHAREVAENRQRLRQRAAIVEGPFGLIKRAMGFWRWTVAGLENVRAQWSWVCTAFNLRKLYGRWRRGTLVWA